MSADSSRRHHQQQQQQLQQQQQQQQHQQQHQQHHQLQQQHQHQHQHQHQYQQQQQQQQQHQHHHHYHLHHHHQHHSLSSGAGGVVGGGAGVNSSIGSSNMGLRGGMAMPAVVPPQSVSDRSILDSAIGFINDVTLVHQPQQDPKDTITWARFETSADVSDPRFGDDWELEGNAAPPLLLILGYGLGAQVWAIPANGEAVEVLSWLHGVVTALRILPTPTMSASALDDNGRADEPLDAFADKRPLVAIVDGGSAAASSLLSGGSSGHGSGHSTAHSSGHSSGSGGSIGGGGVGSIGGYGHASNASTHFSAVNFVSLKTGAQVKTIKFKNPVLDIQANRSSVVISFHERLAVFDARTLEDRLTITTCYPSPGINPNPIALGPRWLAYAENKLLHSKRSGGGCDGEGVPSYTATMLNAAKSFSKGLLELGGQMAAGLTGTTAGSGNSSKSSSFDSATGHGADARHPGVVTIIDVKHPIKDYSPTSGVPVGGGPIIAHFVAHSEAIVAMEFDSSGMLLLTADRRGHDFHVFRIQPHPVGSSLAAVHHLYVLHRGDTSAKVQHIAFSLDSRWAAVSTLRGTTHVFPITPYGGAMGVRTHTSLHVVNKLSRFHRSAGLGADGRSSSPISHSESTTFVQSLQPYHNPTLPPFPRPVVVQPLAQLRQPLMLGSPPGSAGLGGSSGGGMGGGHGVHGIGMGGVGGGSGGGVSSRQRLSSLSDDSGKPLSVCATFAKPRSWLLEPATATREAPHRVQRKAVDSLFVMAGHGALIQYDLDTKLASNVAKEKICDDTPIELEVEAKAQWNLGRRKDGSHEIIPPLALDNWLIKDRHASLLMDSAHQFDEADERADSWLAQVEIITHAGPHRRLWMGPQFVFKNYNTPSGSNLNHMDAEAVEIGVTKTTTTALPSATVGGGPAAASLTPTGPIIATVERSSPLNMPLGAPIGATTVSTAGRSGVPVLIESGSYSSIEQSPKLMDRFRHGHLDSDYGHGDMRLKEDLADAMRESPSSVAARRDTAAASYESAATVAATAAALAAAATSSTSAAAATTTTLTTCDNTCFYDALAEHDAELELELDAREATSPGIGAMSALASVLPNICSYESQPPPPVRVEKMVNPLGTVTDVHAGISGELQTDMLDEVVGQLAAEDLVIHENCDEALFRPVVAIFCNELVEQRKHEEAVAAAAAAAATQPHAAPAEHNKAPVVLGNKLIVPVIAKEVDEVIVQKEKQQKKKSLKSQAAAEDAAQAARFAQLSHLNKPSKATVMTTTTVNTTMVSEDETPGEEDVMQTSISSSLSGGGKMSNKKAKAAKHKAKQSNKKDNNSSKQKQQELEREKEKEREKEREREREKERELELKREREKERELELQLQLKRERELEKEKEKEKEKERELQQKKKEQERQQKEVERKRQRERELEAEVEVEVEADPADSLLANKEIIASVMMSSASAQGLSLHVEPKQAEEEEEEEEESEPEPEPEPERKPNKPTSGVWKSLETAAATTTTHEFPSLSLASSCSSSSSPKSEKLLPELQTPQQQQQQQETQSETTQTQTKLKPLKQLNFSDFLLSSLPPLDMFPVLPSLEPLPALDDDELLPQRQKEVQLVVDDDAEQMPPPSLINFESPLQETAAAAAVAGDMMRKITPPPRGFTEQNLVLALCGSLHYEREKEREQATKTTTITTKTTTTATLRDVMHKSTTSTSNNSSGSEELLLLEEEKKEKKPLAKKQLSKKHKQAVKQQQQQHEDEELRPLISISMCEQLPGEEDEDEEEEEEHEPEEEDEDDNGKILKGKLPSSNRSLPVEDLLHFAGASTTSTSADDSEGPMPATTSDDVADVVKLATVVATPQHKLKTKKLEHKINLIAAIEAATSSSSASSAEESSVEAAATTMTTTAAAATATTATSGNGAGGAATVATTAAAAGAATVSTAATTSAGRLATVGGSSCVGVAMSSSSLGAPPSGQKKKTKRRKR